LRYFKLSISRRIASLKTGGGPSINPELIAAAGPEVTETYIDFFTATIRNALEQGIARSAGDARASHDAPIGRKKRRIVELSRARFGFWPLFGR
jgi:hypothetical protein